MRRLSPSSQGLAAGWLALAALALAGCARDSAAAGAAAADLSAAVPIYTYEVVHVWPHDPGAFTEGLLCLPGGFLESTGQLGASTLRKVDLQTGRILAQVKLPDEDFGEGTAVLGGKIYQLTWQNHKAFVYDFGSMLEQGEFTYEGEGWGLTTDGRSLIMSDGTNRIQFRDPATFAVTRTISVLRDGQPLNQLNELEYVRGEIFANIWQTDLVARIDPATGRLLGLIDFSGLLSPAERARTDVLNGIAYDPDGDRLFVTGKYWPKLFEVRLRPKG